MPKSKKMEVLNITIDKQHQKIKILEKNVLDLQEQVQKSYIRNSELVTELTTVRRELDTLINHHMSEEQEIREEIKNKNSLTQCIEDVMDYNIATFQNILGKLKGV
jgi:predicted  nucleic acid-binding Zn-ribbon protein